MGSEMCIRDSSITGQTCFPNSSSKTWISAASQKNLFVKFDKKSKILLTGYFRDTLDNNSFMFSTYPIFSPQITNPCGHPICGHCADQLEKNGSQKCHMCRQPRMGFCRNIFAEQLLVNVKATCRGSRQELRLNEAQNHITKDCMEIEIPCRQCQALIKRKDNTVHSEN